MEFPRADRMMTEGEEVLAAYTLHRAKHERAARARRLGEDCSAERGEGDAAAAARAAHGGTHLSPRRAHYSYSGRCTPRKAATAPLVSIKLSTLALEATDIRRRWLEKL
eukprot:2967038-Pleurochrysis_carterae.AAC.3